MHYIFVDFESVQDINLALIECKAVKVFLFIGTQQNKMDVELMMQAHRLHDQVEIIKMECAGKNALDFVLAHQTGLQAAADPEGFIHILSKDKGFDALVKHLKGKKIQATRSEAFAKIPVLKGENKATPNERLVQAKSRLSTMNHDGTDIRPKKRKTLGNKLQDIFQKMLSNEELKQLIAQMEELGWIAISEDKVAYHF